MYANMTVLRCELQFSANVERLSERVNNGSNKLFRIDRRTRFERVGRGYEINTSRESPEYLR